MLKADEEFFKLHGEPLFSSHMLDLSEEPDNENIEICKQSPALMVAQDGCVLLLLSSASQHMSLQSQAPSLCIRQQEVMSSCAIGTSRG